MKLSEFVEACREFTEYAHETQSGTDFVFSLGCAGPVIVFQAGRSQFSHDPLHAILVGWEEVHQPGGWVHRPTRAEVMEGLELSDKHHCMLMQAIYCIKGHNARLRRDLIEACGLTDEAEKSMQEYVETIASAKKGRRK